ncbi:hypothetical protein ACIHAR_18980 [Streptomyces sp. NPDC052016]|uniref:hypothetical protein n=1 Tax=unclassified Streptomyces TaxID=2593676 RepID=UPI0034467424
MSRACSSTSQASARGRRATAERGAVLDAVARDAEESPGEGGAALAVGPYLVMQVHDGTSLADLVSRWAP